MDSHDDAVMLWIAGRLLAASVHGAVVVAVAWVACRCVPRLPAALQATLWWFVALKLVLALVPLPTLAIPLLPAGAPSANANHATRAAVVLRGAATEPAALQPDSPDPAARWDTDRWRAALVGLWLLLLAGHGVRLVLALRAVRAIRRRSLPCSGADREALARLAARLGLSHAPDIRLTDEIDTPQVVGIRRTTVLVPRESGRHLTAREREMALCHELMHVRRRDLALGLVPALAERLFFFHPLARLAAREYLTAREAACDAAVVSALGVSPAEYGRLLVRFGIRRTDPVFAAGGFAVSTSSLRRRLTMLQHAELTWTSRRSTWCVVSVILLAIMPVRLVANTPAAQATAAAATVAAARDAAPAPSVAQAPAAPVPNADAASAAAPASSAQEPRRSDSEQQERAAAEAFREAADAQDAVFADHRRAMDAMRTTLETLHRSLPDQHPDVQKMTVEFNRQMLALMREERLARERGIGVSAGAQRTAQQAAANAAAEAFVVRQLENLARQQKVLVEQQQRLAEQQEMLATAQRRLSEEAARIREALDRAVPERQSKPAAAPGF